jgi:hypothetical protein
VVALAVVENILLPTWNDVRHDTSGITMLMMMTGVVIVMMDAAVVVAQTRCIVEVERMVVDANTHYYRHFRFRFCHCNFDKRKLQSGGIKTLLETAVVAVVAAVAVVHRWKDTGIGMFWVPVRGIAGPAAVVTAHSKGSQQR